MNLLKVHRTAEDGSKKLDVNLIVELGIKLCALAATVIAIRAGKQAGVTAEKATAQQHFLYSQFSTGYVEQVEQNNAVNLRRK